MAIIPTIPLMRSRAGPGSLYSQAEPGNEGSGVGVRGPGFRIQQLVGSGQWTVDSAKPQAVSCGIRHSALRGLTLIEVMLTLCLLVIMGAMALPQFEKAFSNHRLRKAADLVRTQWCKARVEAMNTGCLRVFRYEIDSNHFRVEGPTGMMADPSATDAVQIILRDNARSAGNNANLGGIVDYQDKTLPKGISFALGMTEADTRSALVASQLASGGIGSANNMPAAGAAPDGNEFVAPGGWSDPIFFYPDGTTSSARLVLKNKDGRMIELLLRGLTGVVKVGDITSSLQQYP
jgi:Tfp pilus assembly protein FimT